MPSTPDAFAARETLEHSPRDHTSLFEGDAGHLTLSGRRLLVALLKHQILTEEHHPDEWSTLMELRAVVKSRLNDMFLDLVIDEQRGVAYKTQVRAETVGRFPTLVRDAAYNREETLLLVFLRSRYLAEHTDGATKVRVDLDECVDAIMEYRPAHATDDVGDERRAINAVESLSAAGILHKTSDETRLVISPAIETLLPVEKLRALLEWLRAENAPSKVEVSA